MINDDIFVDDWPMVSTTMWRLMPETFLPAVALYARPGEVCGQHGESIFRYGHATSARPFRRCPRPAQNCAG